MVKPPDAEQAAMFSSFPSRSETLQEHEYWASALRGAAVYIPAFAGTKLYCLVTEESRCQKLVCPGFLHSGVNVNAVATPYPLRHQPTTSPFRNA